MIFETRQYFFHFLNNKGGGNNSLPASIHIVSSCNSVSILGQNVFSIKAISYGAKDVQQEKVSQLIVDNTYNDKLSPGGHHIITFDMTTGTNNFGNAFYQFSKNLVKIY